MLTRFLAVCVLATPLLVDVAREQDPEAPPPRPEAADEELDAVAAVISRLYETVSFDRGEHPDWDALRALALEGATFVQPTREGMELASTDTFIEGFQDEIRTRGVYDDGFHERVVHHRTRVFGRVAHSFVVFEVRLGSVDAAPQGRGLDSIHLVKHDGSWRVSSIVTEHERRDRPLPAFFLGED